MPFLLPVTASLPARAVHRSTAAPLQGGIGESWAARVSLRRGRSKMASASALRPSSSSTSTSYSPSSSYSSSTSSSSSPPPSAPPPPPPSPQNKTTKERGKTIKEQSKTTKEQRQRRNLRRQQEQQKKQKAPKLIKQLAKPPTLPPPPTLLPPRLSSLFRPSPQRQLERKRREVYGVPPPRALDRVLLWGDAVLLFCCCCSSERIPVGCSLTLATASVLAWVGVALAKGDYSRSSSSVRGFDPISRRRDRVRALG